MRAWRRLKSSERLYYCSAWVVLLWQIGDWLEWIEFPVYAHVMQGALAVLLAVLPLFPLVSSMAIVVLAVAYGLTSLGQGYFDSLLLCGFPSLFAWAVLGRRWGRLLPSCLMVAGIETGLVVCRLTAIAWLEWVALLLQPAIAWSVGALIRQLIDAQARRRLAEQRLRTERERLAMVRVLHDSVANTMSYALLRCRAIEDAEGMTGDLLVELRDVEHAMEQALGELRSKILESRPLADAVAESRSGHGASPATVHRDVLQRLDLIDSRLRKLGFSGHSMCVGDIAALPGDVAHTIVRAVSEIGMNIVKYGEPGEYSLAVAISHGGANIIAVNRCRGNERPNFRNADSDSPSDGSTGETCSRYRRRRSGPGDDAGLNMALRSGHGLASIRGEVQRLGGTVSVCEENGEWSIAVCIPPQPDSAMHDR